MDVRYLPRCTAHAVRLERGYRIYSTAISHRLLYVACMLQYMCKDGLLRAFSITPHCTAGGGINLLV